MENCRQKVVGIEDTRGRISRGGKIPGCGNRSQWLSQCVGDGYIGLGGDEMPVVVTSTPLRLPYNIFLALLLCLLGPTLFTLKCETISFPERALLFQSLPLKPPL